MKRTVHENIMSYMMLSENEGRIGYPTLREGARLSWYKLFKKTKESIIRKWVDVTNGIVKYPVSLEQLYGVYVVDRSGDLAALYEDNQKNIIAKPTKCSCNSCDSANCMCPTVQDGNVQVDVIIEGVPHTNKTFTRLLKNGQVVEESYTWVPTYDSGSNFIKAVEVKSQKTVCSVATLSCGCPIDCEENAALLFSCGCMVDTYVPYMRERYPALYNNFGYYKRNDEDRQIHLFKSNGRKSTITQVMLVYETNGEDMLIPEYATMAFLSLLDWTRKMFSPSFQEFDRQAAKRNYKREELDMIKFLNPIPFEWLVQSGEYYGNAPRWPYYNGVHSDFVTAEVCVPTATPEINNITNISNVTGGSKLPLVGVVDGGGNDDPVSGINFFQNAKLIGLGLQSGGKVKIEIDDVIMASYGQNKQFDFFPSNGRIEFTTGYIWQPDSSLWINLNQ